MGTESGRKEKGKQANNMTCTFKPSSRKLYLWVPFYKRPTAKKKKKKVPIVTTFSLGYIKNDRYSTYTIAGKYWHPNKYIYNKYSPFTLVCKT